jgi:hypothetical protein
VLQHEHRGLPCTQGEVCGDPPVLEGEGSVAGQAQPVRPAPQLDPSRGGADERGDQPVLRSGRHLEVDRDLTAHRLDLAQEHVRGCVADRVAPLTRTQREGVGEAQHTVAGGELGLHDHGALDVAAGHRVLPAGADRPVPCARVEQSREHTRCVEPRRAPPVDRPADRHQRCTLTVPEQRIVLDRSHHDLLPRRPERHPTVRLRVRCHAVTTSTEGLRVVQ